MEIKQQRSSEQPPNVIVWKNGEGKKVLVAAVTGGAHVPMKRSENDVTVPSS